MNPRWTPRWIRVIVAVLLLLSLVIPIMAFAGSFPAAQANIDPVVLSQLTTQKESTVWVVLREKANLTSAHSMKNWEERGTFVVAQLQATANRSQTGVRTLLKSRGKSHKPFWMVNAIKLTADAATINELAQRSDVERIIADGTFSIPQPKPATAQAKVNTVEWGIDRINAPQVWSNFGVHGEGIVIANIDTGVQFDHPALVKQYRGNLGDGSFDHNYNWYDPSNVCGYPSTAPCDNASHGTHTMGTMVGDDGVGNQIGVAPGARWIAAKGCEDMGCSYAALMAAGQWVLAPTDLSGNNPRPDLRPNIVNNSWGGGGGDTFYQSIVDAWVASGIFPQFSNGNSGPYCGSAGSPGDYTNTYAAGAFDINNSIAYFSSRGPSVFGEIKPNIAAPGVDVRSSVPGNGYVWYSGTSMASPHVAGTVALMWSAAPSLVGDIAATRALLDQTAIDVIDTSCDGGGNPTPTAYPPPGSTMPHVSNVDNNVWGEGRLDAYAAVDLSPRGPVGTLAGVVTDAAGAPLGGVSIHVVSSTNSRTTSTGPDGSYSLRLSIGHYDVSASLFGYIGQTVGADVSEGVTTPLNFALSPAPSHAVAGTVRSGTGTPVANANVSILNTPIPPTTTGADGRYSFASVPEGTYDVQASQGGCYDAQTQSVTVGGDTTLDFSLAQRSDAFGYFCTVETPSYIEGDTRLSLSGSYGSTPVALPFLFTFYGQSYEIANVATSGFVSFLDAPINPYNNPIPDTYTPNAAIYPFWDELSVDYDSGVYTKVLGTAPNRQFVIEWRNVHFCCSSVETIDVEVVLFENGKILTQYRNIGDSSRERGDSATIGIENETGTVGLQYSYNQPVIGSSDFAVRYSLPPSGFVQGTVIDKNDQQPINGATVRVLASGTAIRQATTNASGLYRVQVPVGAYTVEFAANNYATTSQPVVVRQDQTVALNATLSTARAQVSPATLEMILPAGQTKTTALTLRNSGTANTTWEISEAGGGRIGALAAASASVTRNPNYDPNARTTQGIYVGQEPRGWSVSAASKVLRSWSSSNLGWAWGVGYTGNVWLSDASNPHNREFSVDGIYQGRTWATPWSSWGWPADMAYDAGRGRMCQVNSGGDNGIYCWNLDTGKVVGSITGSFPWSMYSQRGLAYRPDDDSFYIGGWNEGVIYHIAGLSAATPGAVLGQCRPSDPMISGLAWNPSFNVLWVATNSYDDTIYQLNPDTCNVLSTLAHPSPYYNGGGLEMDEQGNLWMLSQSGHTVYLVESGVPAFTNVPWLTETPTSGTLRAGGTQSIQITFNTTGMQAGVYNATLFVRSNSGRQPLLRVPVSLIVPGYSQAVNAGGQSYTDKTGQVWAADKKFTVGKWGYTNAASKASSTTKKIAGTNDGPLFQYERDDPSEYRFDGLPAGIYQIDLYFADLSAKKAGQRISNVYIEGNAVLPAHDVVGEVGPLTADKHTFYVSVTDGQLNIRFAPYGKGYQVPIVNAIRVLHRPDR